MSAPGDHGGAPRTPRAGLATLGLGLGLVGLLATWLAWPAEPPPQLPVPPAAETPAAGTTRIASGGAPAVATPRESDDVRRDAPRTAPVPAPHAFELVVHAHDEWHLPTWVRGFTFGPADGSVAAYTSGRDELDDGAHRYRWTGAAERGEIVVEAMLLRRLAVRAGTPLHVAHDRTHGPTEPAGLEYDVDEEKRSFDLLEFGSRLAPHAPFVAADDHEQARGSRYWGTPAGPATLTGRVLLPNGEPARACIVRIRGRVATTSDDGTWALTRLAPGTWLVEAGARDGASARLPVTLGDGTTRCDVRLVAAPLVRGRVVDARGRPRADVPLLWWTEDGDWCADVRTASDGTFSVPVRDRATGRLWACLPGVGPRWPAAGGPATADGAPATLVVDPDACRGTIRLAVVRTHGAAIRGVAARVWQRASGLGMHLLRTAHDAHTIEFRSADVPAGQYVLELCSPAFGVVPAGTFTCDGRGDVELRAAMPLLCAVTLARAPGVAAPNELELVRTGGAFPSRRHRPQGFAAPHWLGAGTYEAWWRDGTNENAPARSLAFTVARGATELVLTLP